jgi:hypothetical protein
MPDLVGCCYRRFSGDQARLERNHSWSGYRHTATSKRQRLRDKNRRRRDLLAALPVSSRNRKRLLKQLALRQAIESRALKRKLANQRRAIQKYPHPGVVSSPGAPRTATPAPFDFCVDESVSEAVPAKKGSCEMQGDGAR